MEFSELIVKRESVRNFDSNHPIPQQVLDRILNAGRVAPSAANRQPWEFVVITSPAGLEKVRRCYQRPWFHEVPAVLAVKGDKEKAWVRSYDGYNALETDLTIAMDHIILAAANEGLGTCWIAAFDPVILREALALKPNEVVYAITALGYPGASYQPKNTKDRKDLSAIVSYL